MRLLMKPRIARSGTNRVTVTGCHMNTESIGSEPLGCRHAALGATLLIALSWIVPTHAMADRHAVTTTVSRDCRELARPKSPTGLRESTGGGPIRSMVVTYADLNLALTDGASTLYQRLKLAAREVCKTPDGGYGDPAVWLHCYHAALVGAVRDLGNDRVTALYNGEHKAGIPAATARSTQ